MTTIACDGKSMAADSQCGGETHHCDVTKVVRAKGGALLACCGHAYDLSGFVKWWEEGREGAPNVGTDFEGFALKPDGELLCIDKKGRSFVHPVPAALGSGCRFAYGAMDAGCSPEKAVRIAAKRDSFTGGPVKVLYLEQPHG